MRVNTCAHEYCAATRWLARAFDFKRSSRLVSSIAAARASAEFSRAHRAWLLWMMRREFDIFLHPPQQILATSERHGLKRIADQQGMLWTMAALRRTA